jgi:hypothetical protein
MSQLVSVDAELHRYTDHSAPDRRLIAAVLQYAESINSPQSIDRLLRNLGQDIKPHLVRQVPGELHHRLELQDALVNTYRWLFDVDPDHGLPRLLSFKASISSDTCQSYASWIYESTYADQLQDLPPQRPDRVKRFKKDSHNTSNGLGSNRVVPLDASQSSEDSNGLIATENSEDLLYGKNYLDLSPTEHEELAKRAVAQAIAAINSAHLK